LGFKGLAVAGNPSLTAHAITAHTAMTRMSISRCSTLPVHRGSSSAEKCSTRATETVGQLRLLQPRTRTLDGTLHDLFTPLYPAMPANNVQPAPFAAAARAAPRFLVLSLSRARLQDKASLRRMQWQAAQSGSIPMMICLGKNLLGQRNKIEDQPVDLGPLPWTD
jgi:hypothetical protein